MQRKPETISFWCGRLPHWEVVDGRYFVTLHLAGAIPAAGQQRIHEIAAQLERMTPNSPAVRLKVQRKVFAELESWLDRAIAVRHLAHPDVAAMVCEAIVYRESRDWKMLDYVVMPNHLHLFFELLRQDMKGVLERFKRWTGHEAGRLIALDGKDFWQGEWFDHWSRSDAEDEKIRRYIRENPIKAGLVTSYEDWPYGSWNK